MMKKSLLFILILVLSIVAILYITLKSPGADDVEIIQQWNMPEELVEISGIAYINEDRIACIQDEDGIIYIYDLGLASVYKRIDFGPPGDYESITLVGATAYILRSDGTIFEVPNFETNPGNTIVHTNAVSNHYDFEGLAYDQSQHRLLVAPKENLKDSFLPIFAFDISTAELRKEPAFKIYFNDSIFKDLKRGRVFRPSEISIDPGTGKIYILEGVNPKLLILDSLGNPQIIRQFNKLQFNQPEGITFGNDGQIFISNEGNGKPGNILQVRLDL